MSAIVLILINTKLNILMNSCTLNQCIVFPVPEFDMILLFLGLLYFHSQTFEQYFIKYQHGQSSAVSQNDQLGDMVCSAQTEKRTNFYII